MVGFRFPKTKWMLRREAAGWLARMQSGREPDIDTKLQDWRDVDPRHAAAFDRVRRSYEQAGLLRQSPTFATEQHRPPIGRRQWKPLPALAAAAAAIILVPVGIVAFRGTPAFGGTQTLMLMTKIGEIRRVRLADGSEITLDTVTKVDVEIGRTRRTAHLRYGRARFRVAAAKAPFVVETGGTTITARDGAIDVEQVGNQGRVDVLSGAADLNESVTLKNGETAIVGSGRAEKIASVRTSPDWTSGMLQFDRTPLAQVIALANRYSTLHIILVGDLASLRVTGAFRAGDTRGLAKALAAAFSLSLEQGPDGNLTLSRSAVSDSRNKKRG